MNRHITYNELIGKFVADFVGAANPFVNESTTQTLTNKTLTAPTVTGAALTTATLTAPVVTGLGAGSTGVVYCKSGILTELTGDGTYTITVPIPAGAVIHSIKMTAIAQWTAGTSASGSIGDTASATGYFSTIDMKGTDLVNGESLDTADDNNWGATNGAYLTTAGVRGPASTNFGPYYVAASNILFAVIKAGTGTAGRTHCSVTYSVGDVIAQVVT